MTYRCCPTPGTEKREAIIRDCTVKVDDNPVYVLTTKVNRKLDKRLFFYCTNPQVRNHWLVRVRKDGEEYDFYRDPVVGRTPRKEEVAEETYRTALEWARNRVDSETQIKNETSRGREKKSELEYNKLRLKGPPTGIGSNGEFT